MGNRSAILQTVFSIMVGASLLAALYISSRHSYLLFHSLIELFTIVVAAGIFVIAWNARGYIHNNYLLFLGIASLFVALLDLLHTLAYKGMGVFSDPAATLSTQLWIAARGLQSISLLIAPFWLGRRLRAYYQFGAYAIVTSVLIASIFYWHIFPITYVNGVGTTIFKQYSEYVISLFLLASVALLHLKRTEFDPAVLRFLTIFLILTIASELAFASYVSLFEEVTAIGHVLRFVAFYYLYKAIIETGLVKPYALLLRDLKRSEQRLREEALALQARNDELKAYDHTVAHNLKNPLTIIITAADLVNNAPNMRRDVLKDCLHEIKTTAFEMNSIINDLLLLSEVRNVDASVGTVDMAQAVAHVRKRLNYMIQEHHARLVYPESWPAALGYAPWIEEVWVNYITNALKYGGKSPEVELGASAQDGKVRFWARDHGPGIAPEAQTQLFVPFSRLGQVRKEGHGLGLSIVLHIVKKLGGEVGVESQPGQGSLFYFTLPAGTRGTGRLLVSPVEADATYV